MAPVNASRRPALPRRTIVLGAPAKQTRMGGLVCNHPRCLECPKERTCRYRYTEADNEPTAPRALAIKRAPTNAKVSLRLFIDTLLLLLAIMGALFAIAINYSGG